MTSRGIGIVAIALAAALAAGVSPAQQPAAAPAAAVEKPATFAAGGDLRLRQEYYDDIPAGGGGLVGGGQNNYFRARPRLWGELRPSEDVTIRARVVEEFRHVMEPEDNTAWKAPDEIVVDTLFLDLRNLAGGKLDLRIGRQDLIYGTGMLVLEGTPKDGSRTIYMDGVRATWKGIEKNTVDLFGVYNQPENDLAINTHERDLTGQTRAFDDITESGAGVYWKSQAAEGLPFEAYGIYKGESDFVTGPATNQVTVDELDLATVGVRLMPRLAEGLSGNFELAYQVGERGEQDVQAYGADLSLTYSLADTAAKPAAQAGLYYLSGDDPDTADDEGWNPLWARYPQRSELYVFSFAVGRWENVMMPWAGFSFAPAESVKSTALLGYMWAPEDDGPGDGDARGLLFALKNEFTIAQQLFGSKDSLKGHLWLELLEPGDYYIVDDTAVFARWELMYAF